MGITKKTFAALVAMSLGLPALASTDPSNYERVLIQGVGAPTSTALDPASPDNIAEYAHNFSKIVSLSFMDQIDPSRTGSVEFSADLACAVANLSGCLTPKVRGDLLDLRNRKVDEIDAHSWGAAAVAEALLDGTIRQPPDKLVIIAPPNLTPWGGTRWKELADRFPGMRIEVYINPDDILESIREGVAEIAAHVKKGGIVPADDDPNVTKTVIEYFTARNVVVRTYPAGNNRLDPIEAHRLRHFLDFASRIGLNGITRRPLPVPTVPPPTTSTFETYNEADFLVQASQETAKVLAVKDFVDQREQAIRVDGGAQARDLEAKRDMEAYWRYFLSLLELACQGKTALEHVERSAYSVLFSPTVLGDYVAREGKSLSPCAKQLLAGVQQSDRPVDLAWLKREGERYIANEKKLAKEREAARRRAERAYQRAAAQAAAATRTAGSASDRERGSSAMDRERGGSNPNIDHLSYQQAQGISAGNTRIFDSR